MSASVATGASLKAHMNTTRSLSASPDMDDFEDELQQELENEMSASYDNLFSETEDFSDGSELFGEGSVSDSDKDKNSASDSDKDSASDDDDFEAVDFDLDTFQAELEGNLSADTQPRKRPRSMVHIGDNDLLERFQDENPSLMLHLFDSHFRFDSQEGVFLYNGPMRFFFDALNEGTIPIDLVDVLTQVNCRFFDGCLIVEVHDHRQPAQEQRTKKQRMSELLTWTADGGKIPEPGTMAISAANTAKVYKKVMRPTPETFHLDLHLSCEHSRTRLSGDDILEVESMILLAVEPPLDLEPDFQVSRLSNAIRYIEYGHLLPRRPRKYNSAEIEAEQAEREEKLKLLTLMDDRTTRDFQPSFSRVSQVNEWRHKKYVNDADVYPAAVAPGKKPPVKKGRSQMSVLADGRKVIRTLRFRQTINSRTVHTVFHVVELPDSQALQGIMRWGTLLDTSINGGSKVFAFPNEDIMHMHIDNFKLLLNIENNQLIYDSMYYNGQPTSGPPPAQPTSPTPSASSPTVKSSTSVAKASARNSRKNSPQPKSAPKSVEPEGDTEDTAVRQESPVSVASQETPVTPAAPTNGKVKKSRKEKKPRKPKKASTVEPEDNGDEDKPVVQPSDAVSRAASELPLSPVTASTSTPMTMQSPMPPTPSMANAAIPFPQNAIAFINSQIANMAAAEGRPLTDLPTHITKEYLHANPYYYQMFRKQMALIAMQQQQKQNQGRPGMPPNMAMVAQAMRNAPAASTPGLTSPSVRPAPAPQPHPQMTSEEMQLIQQYCQLMGVQIQGAQDPRLAPLVAMAKSGELKAKIIARMQALSSQQQQQQPVTPANIGAHLANLPPQEKQRFVEALQRQHEAALNGGGQAAVPRPPMTQPMMTSPTPAPAAAPAVMTAAQQQLLQRVQQMQQMQQQQQQQQPQPRPPAANVAAILQQLSSGQINPAMLPPQLIVFLLQNAQAQLSPNQREVLQRLLAHHMQMQSNSATSIRPGPAQ
ncbi:Transcription factor spt20 [Coemansia sp. RSA 1935]|nr:Transcription factor spt20 [Coemansia sp. RSA 1935]